MNQFLRCQDTRIVNSQGQSIWLKGVNLGGWLMMEGYILHSLNYPEQSFKKNFTKILGERALTEFEQAFRSNFIQESDIKNIASLGLNCIRLPFNYRLIEKAPYQYSDQGTKWLDQCIQWARKYNIWVILDLHAAPGAQNHDWHSDSLGKAELWQKKSYQDRACALWGFLSNRYKDEPNVAGYDILNEAVIQDVGILNTFYKKVLKAIRKADKNHIVFIEGNTWATDLKSLDIFDDQNIALSIHCYAPLEFTFNFIPHLRYPLKSKAGNWDAKVLKKMLSTYKEISIKRRVPIFVGEFGVNYRQGLYGEDVWLKDILKIFRELEFHWTYWTYKAIKNSVFPDGVFSFLPNPPWVNRAGPRLGWDTYSTHWPKLKKDISESWRTHCFAPNTKVIEALRNEANSHI